MRERFCARLKRRRAGAALCVGAHALCMCTGQAQRACSCEAVPAGPPHTSAFLIASFGKFAASMKQSQYVFVSWPNESNVRSPPLVRVT
jgi:hypothetical protein